MLFINQQLMAQASTEQFGQNQMQYKTFKWKYYDSTHFRVFFYRPGEKLAEHILDQAEAELSKIVQKMGGRLPRKLNLILYNSYNDYIQTNVGVSRTSDLNEAEGGRLKVSGDNLPIYFTGNHNDLMKQVKQGVANVIKDNLLFGGNIREVVKNAIKMNLPEWFTDGYVQYLSNDWTPELEAEIESLLSIDTSFNYRKLAQKNPKLIGHSFWNYVEQQYGSPAVSRLLYQSRFRKNVDDALKSSFAMESVDFYKKYYNYYASQSLFEEADSAFGRKLATSVKTKFD